MAVWQDNFETKRVRDLIILDTDPPREWENHELFTYFSTRVTTFNREALEFFKWPSQYSHVRSVTLASLVSQFHSFCQDVGQATLRATYLEPTPLTDTTYSQAARRIMRRLG